MDDKKVKPVVVVGIDGSARSGEALCWAARYASLIKGELHAVIAWEHSPGFGYIPGGYQTFEQEAHHTLQRTIDKYLGAERPLEITKRVVRGNPTTVLVEESTGANLLVVGDRGYGGFAGLLLGSVGENCVRHAKCSVIVIRHSHRCR